ncbi:heavy metal translocating P-type ATPase [Acinetobacter johnsonii]|uniref:Copper-transporting P-type ATPase n=1 Tax=Acinetobacter johnsonii TaxID=40214 RepID=A0A380TTU8_ACIJO|nr:heavy metal translocating P-type ATPase [Acinetobacter johnsonii]ENU40063.1 copper-translocating P-type ATPase [Acinetobacter johnsonii CIP 64.6]QPS02911.1 heavy metal translocating P-type ATPase [Acinetobacter johnsonii]SUT91002.1 copper-transporting P-type ATPase [Acinetobacter johnsonii]
MSEQHKTSCCSKQKLAPMVVNIDPVCGMTVAEDSPHVYEHQSVRYLFCCSGCLKKFSANPEAYLTSERAPSVCCSQSKTDISDASSQGKEESAVVTSKGCGCGSKPVSDAEKTTFIDPVCGMTVTDLTKPHTEWQGQDYYFCSEKCLQKFIATPEAYVKTEDAVSVSTSTAGCCGSTPKEAEKKASCCEPKPQTESDNKASCCGGGKHEHTAPSGSAEFIDPVCGMSVDPNTELKTDYQQQIYYFCNPSCLDKFKGDPEFYLIPPDQRPVPEGAADMDYTCPMDPEIVQKGPGTCPICGMALEPMQPTLDDAPNPELVDFSHRFWMTLPLTLIVFVLAMGSHIHSFISPHIQPWIELVLATPVVLWAGKPFIERCWTSYKTRNLNMWSLIGVGVLAAYIYSVVATIFPSVIPMEAKTGHGVAVYFEAACMIVSLSLLGQIMELKARAKTADSLKALLKLQANTAKLVQNDQVVEVDIGMVKQGDILQISSGEQIPLDGVVVEGKTYVDEAMMTGEPVPVKKQVHDTVIGGTVNQQGSIRIQTTAVGANTTLAKMIQTVAEAQRSKAPLQRLADVFAKYFVIIVLLISVLTFAAWMVFGGAQFDLALMCAVAVLIIACPCALGLATPMSVMATTGRAAQKGVLFKDAEAIEALSKVNTLIVDKTGTLTEGKPSLKEIQLLSPNVEQAQVEQWIASIEQYSSHPIAQTLTQLVPAQQLLKVADFEDVTGFGVKGQIGEQTLYIGSQKLLEQLGITLDDTLQSQLNQQRTTGNVISFLSNSQEVLAYISIHDAIKANAQQVIQQLIDDGVEVVMATGDHEQNAQLVAKELGIQQVYGNCTPTEKLEIVKKYQAQGKIVAMAGDGINDAPALAQANVGIAMGNGTDIAKQTAQVTLVKGDIRGAADALHMAKLGVRNMKQNLAFSFVYNGLGVPVAAGIFYPLTGLLLTPMFAAVAMSLSSLSVVLNALRLQKSK